LSEFLFPPPVTIPPLLHAHLSLPHAVCDSPDQAAHYHTLGSKLGGSSVTGTGIVSEQMKFRFFYLIHMSYCIPCNNAQRMFNTGIYGRGTLLSVANECYRCREIIFILHLYGFMVLICCFDDLKRIPFGSM
jgi:hypothetical protein